MSDPVFTQREQQMLRKLAGFILPVHSPDHGDEVYDLAGYLQNFFTALSSDPPGIYGGGPFSGRHPVPDDPPASNDFKQFLGLTRYQRLAWKLRLEGADSLAGEPFVFLSNDLKKTHTGLVDVISEGLASAIALEDGMAKPVMADVLLSAAGPDFRRVFPGLLAEAVFSAPEYGGNLGAWKEIFYPGDSLPAGYKGTAISDVDSAPDPFPIQPLADLIFNLTVVLMNGRKFK
jgi:hypothetical protein